MTAPIHGLFVCTRGWSDDRDCDVSSTGCSFLALILQPTSIACPAVVSRVCATVEETIPDLLVQRRRVTMVVWLNGIFLAETQVGGLVFARRRGGSS